MGKNWLIIKIEAAVIIENDNNDNNEADDADDNGCGFEH